MTVMSFTDRMMAHFSPVASVADGCMGSDTAGW